MRSPTGPLDIATRHNRLHEVEKLELVCAELHGMVFGVAQWARGVLAAAASHTIFCASPWVIGDEPLLMGGAGGAGTA